MGAPDGPLLLSHLFIRTQTEEEILTSKLNYRNFKENACKMQIIYYYHHHPKTTLLQGSQAGVRFVSFPTP